MSKQKPASAESNIIPIIFFAFYLTEQWNVDHKTCPVCRETLASTDDGWVISEGPDSLDVATEIQKSLMDLAH